MKRLWQLILYKARADLQSETHRSYTGILWWIIEPLLSLVVYYAVFGFVFSGKGESYLTFLFVGIVTWRWFQNSVQHAANSLIAHRPLMLLVNVHKVVFPMAGILADSAKFLLSLGVCMILAAISSQEMNLNWLALPMVVGCQLLLVMAGCFIIAAITPFAPDIYLILPTGLQLMMFMSGVFYRIDAMPQGVGSFLRLNPMVGVIDQYRRVLMDGLFPDWSVIAGVGALGVVGMGVGVLLLNRFDKLYPKLT